MVSGMLTAIRDFVRRLAEFAAGQQFRKRLEVDESILMQSDSRFRAKDAGHRLIDSRERQSARVCRVFECCQRRVGHGRLQKQIHSGEKCLHGGFAGSEVPGDASHIHCVSDYEAIEAEFITEQAADNSRRECRRPASFGLERRHG